MPRNVVSGEFTKVVQRVPVRIMIEKDDRWPLLRAGLSVQAEHQPWRGRPEMGRTGGPRNDGDSTCVATSRSPRPAWRRERRAMTATAPPLRPPSVSTPTPAAPISPLRLERRHWLAALAVLVVFLRRTRHSCKRSLTDDSVRKGLQIDEYDMAWQQVGYGVGLLYGVFTGLWLSARIGARYTIALGMLGFALGNLLCGAAVGLETLVLGRFVDGFGKMLVMGLCRTTLYKQFDRLLLVAIGSTESSPTRRATRPRCSWRNLTWVCPGGGCTGSMSRLRWRVRRWSGATSVPTARLSPFAFRSTGWPSHSS